MKLAGVEIELRKETDKGWSGVVSSKDYVSKRYTIYSAETEAEAAREILENWFKQAGIELMMTKQLWLVFSEELKT